MACRKGRSAPRQERSVGTSIDCKKATMNNLTGRYYVIALQMNIDPMHIQLLWIILYFYKLDCFAIRF